MGRSFHHTSRSLINKYTHSLAEEGSKEEGSTQTHSLVVLASRKHKSSNRENIQPKHLSYHIRDGNVIGYPSLGTLYLSLQYIRRLSSQPLVCENSNHFHSTHLLERTIHIFTNRHSRYCAAGNVLDGSSNSKVPCTDRIRDQVLMGQLDPSACCSYGVCKGDVNIQGA